MRMMVMVHWMVRFRTVGGSGVVRPLIGYIIFFVRRPPTPTLEYTDSPTTKVVPFDGKNRISGDAVNDMRQAPLLGLNSFHRRPYHKEL
mmetsp:Transcript_8439/g.13791  ORF Transcript_8439/g.13791 Transcript_8439/m.13791 type:complete len:89 (+) Transcript_8439:1623-1889(+)